MMDFNASSAGGLMNIVRKNPEGLLLLAAGCALLMRTSGSRALARSNGNGSARAFEDGSGLRQEGWSTGTTSSGVSQMADTARQYGSDMASKVADTASSATSALSDYAGQAGRAVSDSTQQAFRSSQSALQDSFARVADDQPLVLPLVGLAVGAAIAAAFPLTRLERRTLGPVSEQLGDTAAEVGRRVKTAAGEAKDRLSSMAEERGLTPEGLKEAAGEVAGVFGDALSGSNQGDGQQKTASPPSTARARGGEASVGRRSGGEGSGATRTATDGGDFGEPSRRPNA